VWECGKGQTDTQTAMTTTGIQFALAVLLMQNVKQINCVEPPVNSCVTATYPHIDKVRQIKKMCTLCLKKGHPLIFGM